MKDEQYATLLRLIADLSEQINRQGRELRKEIRQEIAKSEKRIEKKMEKKMAEGFAKQEAMSMEILNAMSGPFTELENDVRETKQANNERFLNIERHTGLIPTGQPA